MWIPFDINECERRCVPGMSYAPWDNLTALRRAFGSIEIALWDLRGRAEGRPLYALLGGMPSERRSHLTEHSLSAYQDPTSPGSPLRSGDCALLRPHDR